MIGIEAVAAYVPTVKVDNIAQAQKFGENEEFLKTKIGALSLSRKLPEETTSDLAVKAVEALLKKTGLPKEKIQALVLVTQNGDGEGLPHTSAIVQAKLGLQTKVAAFDVSLGCSGYIYGLAILKGLMEVVGMRNAVLVTADPYSKILDPADRTTTLLFGDAATATLLSDRGGWEMLAPSFGTDGSGSEHLHVKDGQLAMNGRQVFNFAATKIPAHIKNYLALHGLSPSDIDLYCLHQGSAAIIDVIARRFPEVQERFISDMFETGNTVSSSIPLLLESRLSDQEHKRLLLSGFGVGLSWATTIIQRREKE